MGQRPLIKNGVVVNVIEIADDTLPCTKARHMELSAVERANYAAKLAEWQRQVTARRAAIVEARQKAFMAQGVVNALRVASQAETKKPKWRRLAAGSFDNRISTAESEARAALEKLAEAEAAPIPMKPKHERRKRWIHPDGHEVGAKGGNIGDRWDGKKYIRPEKPKAA
jgi:hypothetical protein